MHVSETSFLELFSFVLGDALTEREQSFVELRYGLVSREPYTLEQVAQVFSLSRERIRQVLERSLRKIQHRGKRVTVQTSPNGFDWVRRAKHWEKGLRPCAIQVPKRLASPMRV